MTDDDKLAALFRDAAGAPPPSSFDRGDVTAASRRITVRRRAALVTGAVVLVAAAGIGSVLALPRGADTATSVASGPAAPQADNAERDAARAPAGAGAAAAPAQAAAAPPLGPGTGECANRQDPALRALVEQALPEVAGATAAATTDVCLPGAERYLSLEVAGGLLNVSYLPPGVSASLPAGNYRSAPTASGGTVIVGSRSVGGGPAPYAGRLPELLVRLAAQL